MNTLDTIYSRKSIRSFTGDPVSDATLNEILKAAKASKSFEELNRGSFFGLQAHRNVDIASRSYKVSVVGIG